MLQFEKWCEVMCAFLFACMVLHGLSQWLKPSSTSIVHMQSVGYDSIGEILQLQFPVRDGER